MDPLARTLWPGVVRADGTRYIRRINGFFEDEPAAYWFIGFASRFTADVFWFCREGDTKCPVDEKGAVQWDRVVGNPVFARIPGEEGFSPFWFVWVVYVPDDYPPNGLKSARGIDQAAREGLVRVEPLHFDHGGDVGVDETVMHCLLVLDGTELEFNGEEVVYPKGRKGQFVPPHTGWHKQYRIAFYDFTQSEGVFSPDPLSESRPLARFSDIMVFFRDCDGGSQSEPCRYSTAETGAVSERGVEADITGDGDKGDSNNIIVAFPGKLPADPQDLPYSPLWRVRPVRIPAAHDGDVRLIDNSRDQNDTDIKHPKTLREYVAKGLLEPPGFMSEEVVGNPIPGNDGKVFFNCPVQIPEEE